MARRLGGRQVKTEGDERVGAPLLEQDECEANDSLLPRMRTKGTRCTAAVSSLPVARVPIDEYLIRQAERKDACSVCATDRWCNERGEANEAAEAGGGPISVRDRLGAGDCFEQQRMARREGTQRVAQRGYRPAGHQHSYELSGQARHARVERAEQGGTASRCVGTDLICVASVLAAHRPRRAACGSRTSCNNRRTSRTVSAGAAAAAPTGGAVAEVAAGQAVEAAGSAAREPARWARALSLRIGDAVPV